MFPYHPLFLKTSPLPKNKFTCCQLGCIIQTDCMVWQAGDIPVVLIPTFQETQDRIEKEEEDEKKDDDFLDTHTEG